MKGLSWQTRDQHPFHDQKVVGERLYPEEWADVEQEALSW